MAKETATVIFTIHRAVFLVEGRHLFTAAQLRVLNSLPVIIPVFSFPSALSDL